MIFTSAISDMAHGIVRIGTMICFDREFPESARVLMLRARSSIFTPNACQMEEKIASGNSGREPTKICSASLWQIMLLPRKMDIPSPLIPSSSMIHGSRNTLVVEAGENEEVFLATFDMDKLRDWRQREVLGNAFRKYTATEH